MNSRNKIVVGASSMVSLKAELIKKQQQFQKTKLETASSIFHRSKPLPKLPKKNPGVDNRSKRDLEVAAEEDKTYAKARSILEEKAKLYEKLSAGGDCELSKEFMVNFNKKTKDNCTINQSTIVIEDDEDILTEDVPPPNGPEEEWVEYTDTFGRSRKCLRKDLQFLQNQDKSIASSTTASSNYANVVTNVLNLPVVLPDNEQKDLLHKKWEKEEDEASNKPNVHYQDVLYDEVRQHGVGYFAFAKDEEKRKEQMELLQAVRAQTEDNRNRMRRIKQKRQAISELRLKKVLERKRLKMGLPLEVSDADTEKPEDIPLPLPVETTLSNESTADKKKLPAKKSEHIRPWDYGKPGVFGPKEEDQKSTEPRKKVLSQEEWVDQRREDRKTDFAPPSSYCDKPQGYTYFSSTSGTKQYWRDSSSVKESGDLINNEADLPEVDQHVKPVPELRRGLGAEIPPPTSMDYYVEPVTAGNRRGVVKIFPVNSACVLLKSEVKPSQRLNAYHHHPWAAVDPRYKTVLCGYCDCTAGLGETCSHVAALLFKVEAGVRLGFPSVACTYVSCEWNNDFVATVEGLPVSQIQFYKTSVHDRAHKPVKKRKFNSVAPTPEKKRNFL